MVSIRHLKIPYTQVIGWITAWAVCVFLLLSALQGIAFIRDTVRPFAGVTFEKTLRQALDAGDYVRANQIASGAMRVWVGRQDVDGMARLLRSRAAAEMNDLTKALEDLRAAAAFWKTQPWYVTDSLQQDVLSASALLAERFCARNQIDQAFAALSAGARGTTAPGLFLKKMTETLSQETKSKLWQKEPMIRIEDFETKEAPPIELRGTLNASKQTGLDNTIRFEGNHSAFLQVQPPQETALRAAVRLHLRLSADIPFGIRFRAHASNAVINGGGILFWADGPFQTHTLPLEPKEPDEQGWYLFDAPPSLLYSNLSDALQEALRQNDLEVLDIEVRVSPKDQFTLNIDAVDVYLPQP